MGVARHLPADQARRGRKATVVLQAQRGRWVIQGQPAAAEAAYAQLLQRAPGHVAARNNLAVLLARRGCIEAARSQLSLARSGDPGSHATTLADTATEIESLAHTAHASPQDCPAT